MMVMLQPQNAPTNSTTGFNTRLQMMRQVNTVTNGAENPPTSGQLAQARKDRREAELSRRRELVDMDAEDYTGTPEGDARLGRYEARLAMQSEDLTMRHVMAKELEKQRLEQELVQRQEQELRRQQVLAARQEAQRQRQQELEEQELEKRREREERMKVLKAKAEHQARVAKENAARDAEAKAQAKWKQEQELVTEAIERETMAFEEDAERHRMAVEAEEALVLARIQAEEQKWIQWEKEEEAREAEEDRKRKERRAAQYAHEKERRKHEHSVKKSNTRQSPKTPAPSKSLQRKSSMVQLSPVKEPVNAIDVGQPLTNFTSLAKLQAEQRRCAGQKRKLKLALKQCHDGTSESESSALQVKLTAFEHRLDEIKTFIANPASIARPVASKVAPVVAPLDSESPTDEHQASRLNQLSNATLAQEQQHIVSQKRKLALKMKQQKDNRDLVDEFEDLTKKLDRVKSVLRDRERPIDVASLTLAECITTQAQLDRREDASLALEIGHQIRKFEDAPFAVVVALEPDSAAARAGVQMNDFVSRVGALVFSSLTGERSTPSIRERVDAACLQKVESSISICIQRWDREQYIIVECDVEPTTTPGGDVGWTLDSCIEEEEPVVREGTTTDTPVAVSRPFLIVNTVEEHSPAQEAGFAPGDYVERLGTLSCLSFPNTAPYTEDDESDIQRLSEYIQTQVDQDIHVTISRWNDRNESQQIELILRPRAWSSSVEEDQTNLVGCDFSRFYPEPLEENQPLGAGAGEAGAEDDEFLIVHSVDPQSLAERIGLMPGDCLVQVAQARTCDTMVALLGNGFSSGVPPLVIQRWTEDHYEEHELVFDDDASSSFEGFGCEFTTSTESSEHQPFPCQECLESPNFSTSAHAAAYLGHFDCLEYLSQYFDILTCGDEWDRMPMFYAAYANQVEILEFLLSISSSSSGTKSLLVNHVDTKGDSALHAAASAGAVDCVELLLEADANANVVNFAQLMTPLHMALNVETLEVLFNRGADVLLADVDGKLALHHACLARASDCVEFLCEMCPEFSDARDSRFGHTPLHDAASVNFADGIQLLLLFLEDPAETLAKVNHENQTALDIAQDLDFSECIEALTS